MANIPPIEQASQTQPPFTIKTKLIARRYHAQPQLGNIAARVIRQTTSDCKWVLLVDWINEGSGGGTTGIGGVCWEAVGCIEVVGIIARFGDGDGWRPAADDSKIYAGANVKTKDFQLIVAVVKNISKPIVPCR